MNSFYISLPLGGACAHLSDYRTGSVYNSLPLGEIPLLGEMGKAQKGCRSCKEKVGNLP